MMNGYDYAMTWHDRLREARDKAGVSDTDIARALDVSNPTVYGWMKGKTVNIEARNLLPLCKFLRVSPFWILLEDKTEYDFAQIPSDASISAADTLRLISAYAQTDDEGRQKLIAAAEETKKLFPRK